MEVDNDLSQLLKNASDVEDTELTKCCLLISNGLTEGRFTILQLTEELGGLLMDMMPPKRARGVLILSYVLELLPNSFLSQEQLSYICTFYCNRLKDHHEVIPPTLRGMLALVRCNNLPDGVATAFLNTMFQNVSCQQQVFGDRLTIYQIFRILLDTKLEELKSMQYDFVYGVISFIDGERDPRALLDLLKWLPKFITSVQLGHLLEEMFEVVACYFPIDFKAPTQEKNAVTREQLAEVLGPCLCSTPDFAQSCIPLALEKFDSELMVAKLDSLELLRIGCKTFDPSSYLQHSKEIWSALYKQLLNNPDRDLECSCLDTLTKITEKLSYCDENDFKDYLKNVIDNTKGNLLPDSKLFKTTVKILLSAAKANYRSSEFVIKEIVPILTNTYALASLTEEKIKILEALVGFLNTCNRNTEELNPVPAYCLEAIISGDSILQSAGLQGLTIIHNFAPIDIRKSLYKALKTLLTSPQSNNLRKTALTCFERYATQYEAEIKELVKEMCSNGHCLSLYLDSLGYLAKNPSFTKDVLVVITDCCKKSAEEAQVSFSCLRRVLEREADNDGIYYCLGDMNFVSDVVDWMLQNSDTVEHKNLLKDVSKTLNLLVGSLNDEKQKIVVSNEYSKIEASFKRKELPALVLLNGLLLRIRRDFVTQEILNILLEIAVNSQEEFEQDMAVKLLANILNKIENSELLQATLLNISFNSVGLLCWLVKALAMRNHHDLQVWVDRLFHSLGKNDAKAFEILMMEDCDALSSNCFCKISVLYRQKLFNILTGKLVENSDKMECLEAFGYLLRHTPYVIFKLQFKKILKLIVKTMDECVIPEILSSLLEKLEIAINSAENFMDGHIEEILPRLLNLSSFKPSMKVRISALRCLRGFTSSYPIYKLLIYKNDVLKQLGKCLDDHKRLVRKQAAESRLAWFMVDAPV